MPADFKNFLDAIQDIKFGFQQFESHFTTQEKETFTKLVAFEESLRNGANQDSIQIEVDPDFEDAAQM